MKSFIQYLQLFFHDKASKRFMIGTWVGLGFSTAVILSTIGIMDGFEKTITSGLKKSVGEFYISGTQGFFKLEDVRENLELLGVKDFTPIIQSQAFLVSEDHSQGVLVKGIEFETLKGVTGLEVSLKKGEVAIGKALAKRLHLSIGDSATFLFAGGNQRITGVPEMISLKIAQIIEHGIYQKDMRIVYLPISELDELLDLRGVINQVQAKLPTDRHAGDMDEIRAFTKVVQEDLGFDFRIRPYWTEYGGLLKAVKAEKFYITVILQIIVIVAIFNVMAFLIYISESKSREIFLLRSIGMTGKKFAQLWYKIIGLFWVFSSLLALWLVEFFDYLLGRLPFFSMPGTVYHMERFSLQISGIQVFIVLIGVLGWMLLISRFSINRVLKQSPLKGIRKEYS